jgi:hypothetical protein
VAVLEVTFNILIQSEFNRNAMVMIGTAHIKSGWTGGLELEFDKDSRIPTGQRIVLEPKDGELCLSLRR